MLKHLAALPAVMATLLLSLTGTTSAASSACAQPALPERPELEQYQDYSAFIADIMAFKRLEAELDRTPARCTPADSSHPASLNEDLGDAVTNARRLPSFDYQRHRTWYDRSTSQSFVLQRLSGTELADKSLHAGPLAEQRLLPRAALVRLPPDWFHTQGDEEQALYRDNEARRVELANQDGGVKQVQHNGTLILFYDHDGALARVRGDVYVSSGRCVANCLSIR